MERISQVIPSEHGSDRVLVGISPSENGPLAIENGPSLAEAKSHWLALDPSASGYLAIEVELTGDRGFASDVVDTSGVRHSCTGTWEAAVNGGAKVEDKRGTGCDLCLSGLDCIAGSTENGAFAARGFEMTIHVKDPGVISLFVIQRYGPCSFTLAATAIGD